MENDYVYIDFATKFVYCCHRKHVCFTTGGTEAMASTFCPLRIPYRGYNQRSLPNRPQHYKQ